MQTRRAGFGITSVLVALMAAGCHESLRTPGTVFTLGVSDGPVAMSRALPKGSGQLTVQLSGVMVSVGRKHVLATVADIDHIVVILSADGQPDRTQSVDKSALTSGQTSVTFGALPPGTYRIVVKAYDTGGTVIGESTNSASVVADTVTQADVGVVLAPSYVQPSPAGGSTGGSGTGGLTTDVTIVDGPTLESPSPLPASLVPDGTYPFNIPKDGNPRFSAVDRSGNVWVSDDRSSWLPSSYSADLVKYAPNGTELLRTQFGQTLPSGTKFGEYSAPAGAAYGGVGPLLVDADNNLWAGLVQDTVVALHPTTPLDAGVMRLAPDGTKLGHYLKDSYVFDMAEGQDGDVWVSAQQFSNDDLKPWTLYRFGRDGTQKQARPVPEPFGDDCSVGCDPFGNVWTIYADDSLWNETPKPGLLRKYMPGANAFNTFDTGERLRSMSVDRLGQVWVGAVAPGNTLKLLVYSNSGTKLDEKAWTNGITNGAVAFFYFKSDRSGRIWVEDDYGAMKVYDPTTLAEVAAYPSPGGGHVGVPLSFDYSGHMWRPDFVNGKVSRIPIR